MLQVHRALDCMVGEPIPAAAETGVVAFSMCGMGPNHFDIPSMVLLPGLLYRNAFGHALSLPPALAPVDTARQILQLDLHVAELDHGPLSLGPAGRLALEINLK
jgi:hypothetical protein